MRATVHNNKNGFSVLVAVENYPGAAAGKSLSHKFVHVRNLYYQKLGIDVTVLSFAEKASYTYEGIDVISVGEYRRRRGCYDLLLCHQPNLKHHLLFCLRYSNDFIGMVFFFHGHEVLKISQAYPKPYPYVRSSSIAIALRDMYDELKFHVWRCYFSRVRESSFFVFVSQWMYDEFMKWLRVDQTFLSGHARIIPNCIGSAFEDNHYNPDSEPEFDLVTIRGNLDTSKYALDLVVESALANPQLRYLVIGKGAFFNHFQQPANLTWLDSTLSHVEIIQQLNKVRCALMPTRTDAQGLMMCEMASFGIPLITSDVPVCHEVLDQFENVRFLSNDGFGCELSSFIDQIPAGRLNESSPFSKRNTISKEVELMQDIVYRSNG